MADNLPEERRPSPLVEFKRNLKRLKDAGELDMLPSNVSFESFKNAAVVAITDNPAILQCSQESIFKSVRRLAAAGLVPDGREAAIVPFKGQAQAMPMVFGLLKVARNSGEISSIWAEVVRGAETFTINMVDGERKFEHTYDPMKRDGQVEGAYAVAKLKDGTIEVEAMGRSDIEKRRRASATQKSDTPTGVWGDWYEEMAKKTVIRALVKRLPLSAEDHRRLMVEDDANAVRMRDITPEPAVPRKNLAQRLTDAPETGDSLDGDVLPPETDGAATEAPHWTADIPHDDAFPGNDEYSEGAKAFEAGKPYHANPYEGDAEKAVDWAGGWLGAKGAQS